MKRGFTILLAEDDNNDATLFQHAVEETAEESRIRIRVCHVRDGAEAIAYLAGQGDFADRRKYPFPDLIVLDLKMPRESGLDVLRWLKTHEEYWQMPKILLSGSAEERDVREAYRLGANTYFQKPPTLTEYRELVHHLVHYWAHMQRPVIRHV